MESWKESGPSEGPIAKALRCCGWQCIQRLTKKTALRFFQKAFPTNRENHDNNNHNNAHNMASSSSLHHYYQLYEETLTSYVPHMFAFTDKYREVLPISAVIIYLIMVFCLPPLLKSKDGQRKPVGALLKYSMITWNLFLSVFSGVLCVLSALPFFINFVSKRGFIDTICDTKHDLFLPSSMLFWGLLFVFSKYIELFDTLFLILKNPERPVPFLHWYHHTTVLLFSWYATTSRYTLGYYFGAINASVHTLMYYYYFQMVL